MPKNKGKGGKNRRRGKNENEETKRQLEFKEPGQEYSQVVRMLGNGRCECYCFDGVTRLGHIRYVSQRTDLHERLSMMLFHRGKMRKKVWVSAGDIVLVEAPQSQVSSALWAATFSVVERIPKLLINSSSSPKMMNCCLFYEGFFWEP